jgi:hypothetical protein
MVAVPLTLEVLLSILLFWLCKRILLILKPVDLCGRHETPAGLAGQGETPQMRSALGGSPTARAALRAWSTNQQTCLTQPIF